MVAMLKKPIFIILLLITLPILSPSIALADISSNNLKAAFIRNDDLWMKTGYKERQLTHGEKVRYPKWSNDSNWIAYLKGGDELSYSGDLWLYNVKMNNHMKIKTNVNPNFQWAPLDNRISFLINKQLYVVNLDPAIPFLVTSLAPNIENFSWLPDGKGLIASSREREELHSDIILKKITVNRHKPTVKHFFTIPVGEDEFYVSTSQFKWSHDQKWLSFLLIPTASLSADANTLCLLSEDGRAFKRLGDMLNDEDWFSWAPTKGVLGYIAGVGREALKNKQLKTVTVPSFQVGDLSPIGYADRDFFWKNNAHIYVSRSKEGELTEVNTRPLPSIFDLNILTKNLRQLTFPPKNAGDFIPQFTGRQLVWIRTNRHKADVLVSKPDDRMKERFWIKQIDLGTWYYEKGNWDEVFSLYKARL